VNFKPNAIPQKKKKILWPSKDKRKSSDKFQEPKDFQETFGLNDLKVFFILIGSSTM